MKYPYVKQHDSADCGAACLSMICEYYGLKISLSVARSLIKVDSNGANILGIIEGGKELGLNGEALKGTFDDLVSELNSKKISLPIIARIDSEGLEHFVVVYKYSNNVFTLGDPEQGIILLSDKDFSKFWAGQIITFEVSDSFVKGNARKGTLSKFFSILFHKKRILAFLYLFSSMSIIISFISAFLFGYIIYFAVYGDGSRNEQYIEKSYSDVNEESNLNLETTENHEHSDGMGIEEYILHLIEGITPEDKFNLFAERIDNFFNNENTTFGVIIVAYLFQLFIILMRNYLVVRLSKEIEIPIVTEYFEHLVDLPMEALSSRKTGELISRFSDAGRIRDAISNATITLLLDTLIVIFGSLALWNINHYLFIISLGVIFAYVIIILLFINPVKKANKLFMESNARMTSYVKETISGIETIKAYSVESKIKERASTLYVDLANRAFRGQIIFGIQDSLSGTAASMGIATILWAGSKLIAGNNLTVSTLFTFYYIFNFFIEPVKNIVELQPTLQTAEIAAERLDDIIGVEVENYNSGNQIFKNGDIIFENVSFRYGYRDLVLKNISIRIPCGKKVAVIGKSGSGKTTLAKLLLRFYQPEEGNISIGGKT